MSSFSITWFVSLFVLYYAVLATANGYAPRAVTCPSNSSLIREGNSVSPREASWIQARHKKTNEAIREYLDRVGVDTDSSIVDNTNHSINVALAFSGGGLRAMLNAAGQIAALDNRTADANEVALGGVLQSATYIAGLSGGSWTLSSLIFQDWSTVDEVVFENPYDVWDYDSLDSFVNTSDPLSLLYDFALDDYNKTLSHISWWNTPTGKGISEDLSAKQDAGFHTSITDAWGRLLVHELFIEGSDNWMENATWSDIRDLKAFVNHDMPFPVITALARRPDSLVYDLNSPIVEFNPYEMGSFDTSINTFHEVKYLGTSVANGVPDEGCVQGFDNAAFVVGTSSSLFNQYLNTLVCDTCDTLNSLVKYFVKKFLESMSAKREDIAWYEPNPFYLSEYSKSDNITSSDTLYLMDGGLAGEIVPLSTIAVKERELDIVFSFDNNGPEWPDGTSLINTYERQFTYEGKSTVCPYVPGQSTFTYYNLTAKPTFFGCNASNLTALTKDGVVPPIVIYVANRPYEFYSNTSTFKLIYSDNEKKGMVTNGFDIASRANDTEIEDWQICVGCAMIRRAEEKAGIEQSDQCKQCFEYYCWDGSLYEDPSYSPPPNFTADGLTYDPMQLDTSNAYIQVESSDSVILSFLPGTLSELIEWLVSLF